MKHKFLKILLATSAFATNTICLVGCVQEDKDVVVTKDYKIVLQSSSDKEFSFAHQINEALSAFCGFELPIVSDISPTGNLEIVFDQARDECKDIYDQLKEDEYIIKTYHHKILIVSKSHMARMCAVDHLLTKYASSDGLIVPKDLEVKGYCNASDVVTEVTLPEDPDNKFHEIRDPFMVKTDDGYWLYGTSYWDGLDWRVYHHELTGSLKDNWDKPIIVAEKSGRFPDIGEPTSDYKPQRWAPEVHKYNGAYYMFTTYHSISSNKRGVTILKSEKPEGPFDMISTNPENVKEYGNDNHHITDDKLGDTIDGTLYVDPQGQPWLVYVNEWVAQPDNVGRFSAVKFKTDTVNQLSEIDESTNQELFRADVAPWGPAGTQVTDGCFIHTMASGRLIMTWSADNGNGYSVGFASSDNGILGPWVQHRQQLFASGMYSGGNVEGGHCMIYEDNGQLYMCLHGPNFDTEHPFIIPVKETSYNTIAWDLYHEEEVE